MYIYAYHIYIHLLYVCMYVCLFFVVTCADICAFHDFRRLFVPGPAKSVALRQPSTDRRRTPDPQNEKDSGAGFTWAPKVCRIIAVYRFWAIILPTFGDLGM